MLGNSFGLSVCNEGALMRLDTFRENLKLIILIQHIIFLIQQFFNLNLLKTNIIFFKFYCHKINTCFDISWINLLDNLFQLFFYFRLLVASKKSSLYSPILNIVSISMFVPFCLLFVFFPLLTRRYVEIIDV